MFRKTAMFVLVMLSASAWAAEDYTQWSYYRPVSVNTKSSGLSGTVKKIPILIRLTSFDTVVFNHTQPGGQDIRFSKNDSVARHIPYQIERWDATNKLAEIWVLPDSVKAGDSIAYLRMFWGNAAAADSQKASAVFDVANGFIGVWHLAESPVAGTANVIKDATANGLNATAMGTMAAADLVPGIIGNAHHFNGTDAGDSIPFAAALNSPDGVTLSAWINPASFNPYSRIISHDMPRDSMPYTMYCLNTADSAAPRFRGEVSSDTQFNVQGKGDIKTALNIWYYITFTYDKTALKMFRNGVQDSISVAGVIPIKTTPTTPLMIGKSNHGTNLFKGIIDEPTVAKVARSADWIKLCYVNQTANSAVVGLGPVTMRPPVTAPSISVQPVNTWAAINSTTAKIGLKATGDGVLTYQWTKNGTTNLSAKFKDTLTLDTVKRTDAMAVYQCKISNTAGSITSAPCTLHVVAALFSATPTSGNDTLTVLFADSSLGNSAASPMKWNWSFGDQSKNDTVKNPVHFYANPNGSPYNVKLVVTANGVADSAAKVITVNKVTLQAGFKPDTAITTIVPFKVTFTDTSKGTITKRLWKFGDGDSLIDSSRASVQHTYTKLGSFTVSLTVSGPTGLSTQAVPGCILIYDPSATNPIRLSGQLTSGSTLAVTLSTYGNLSDSGGSSYVKRIELWSEKNAMPADTVKAALLNTYTLAQLKAAGSQFTTSVTPPGSYLPTDSVGLMAVIVWNTGVRSAFNLVNGTYVLMRDITKPANNLSLSGAYQGDSTLNLLIDNVSTIDTVKTPFVKVEYDFTDSVNFLNTPLIEISAGLVVRAAINNRYTAIVYNSLFGGARRSLYCAVSLKGQNSVLSLRKTCTVQIGFGHPDNPIHLSAQTLTANAVQVSWPRISDTLHIDSIRIWYTNKNPIPYVYDVSTLGFLKVNKLPTDTIAVVEQLEPNNLYFFGAQVARNGQWSQITGSSSDTAITLVGDTTKIPNTLAFDTAFFDTSTNTIMVVYRIDTTGHYSDALDRAVLWSTAPSAVDSGVPKLSKRITKTLDTIPVDLSEQLQFDTKFYIGLWLRKQGALWSPPTDSSKGSVQTPSFTWQNVKFGDGHPIAYADNQKFKITIDTSKAYPNGIDQSIIQRGNLPPIPVGFIPLSAGYEFRGNGLTLPKLNIGVKYDVVPAGHVASEIKIYRYKNGVWLLDRSSLTYDGNGYISVFTKDIQGPFIAMIDTMHPSITPSFSVATPVASGVDIANTFYLSDNIANVAWKFVCAQGGSAYDPAALITDTLRNYIDSASDLIISGGLVNATEGVRALFIVDDGVHIDTLPVSRRVIRQSNSDVVSVKPMKWTPLRVTAFLDKPRVPSALSSLSPDTLWKYDITKFRLFRWYTYPGNAGKPDTNKWVEYADTTDSLFSFVPGRVTWLKTRNGESIDFGRSVTPDLIQSQTITVQPKTWTDIALPYHFDIKLGDILKATPDPLHTLESVLVIGWTRASDTGKFIPVDTPVYLAPFYIDSTKTVLTQINNSQGAVYSVFNNSASPITLTIPPIPIDMSAYTVNIHAHKASPAPWLFKVTGWTSAEGTLASVYCVFKEGKPGSRYYPAAPSFGEKASIRFCNEDNGRFGYALRSGSIAKDGGVTYTLTLHNGSNQAQQMRYTVEALNGVPPNMRAALIDPATGALENAAGALTVSIDAGGSVSRQLVIGSVEYLAKARASVIGLKLALVGVYPNPFKRSMRIRFSVPAAGLRAVKFDIFNPSGREIWNATVACAGLAGPQEYLWNGKSKNKGASASGMYIVRMIALNPSGGLAGVFEKKIMYLP